MQSSIARIDTTTMTSAPESWEGFPRLCYIPYLVLVLAMQALCVLLIASGASAQEASLEVVSSIQSNRSFDHYSNLQNGRISVIEFVQALIRDVEQEPNKVERYRNLDRSIPGFKEVFASELRKSAEEALFTKGVEGLKRLSVTLLDPKSIESRNITNLFELSEKMRVAIEKEDFNALKTYTSHFNTQDGRSPLEARMLYSIYEHAKALSLQTPAHIENLKKFAHS